ncbi:MAG: ABC transporter substrate-binding protein [Sporichthyaceae bacterium]
MRRVLSILPTCVAFLAFAACSGGAAAQAPDETGCVQSFEPGRDYFPTKSSLKYATNLRIDYRGNYQVVTVPEPAPKSPAQVLVLVRCGTPTPELTGDLANATVVQTPVRKLFSGSTTHLPFLSGLDRLDVLGGVSSVGYVTSPEVRERVTSGGTKEYAANGETDVEAVLAAKPDAIVGVAEDKAYPALRRAGVPVLAVAEYLEATALGRAEWVKFFAALTNTEAKAATVFGEVEQTYLSLRQKIRDAGFGPESTTRPTVVTGLLLSGDWYVPGAGSFVANYIVDAGGAYVFADRRGNGSAALSFEQVLARGRDADVWLTNNNDWDSRAEVIGADQRYRRMTALGGGRTWNANKVLGPGGGNDFYERGVARPDLVLADLVEIFHPELIAGSETTFYRPMT